MLALSWATGSHSAVHIQKESSGTRLSPTGLQPSRLTSANLPYLARNANSHCQIWDWRTTGGRLSNDGRVSRHRGMRRTLFHATLGNKSPAAFVKRNWPSPKARPSLNREASRLGDVRIRRPSFRAQVPETRSGLPAPETLSELSIARVGISRFTRLITNGNSVWLVCKNRNAVPGLQKTRVNSPQPRFSSIGLRLLCATENRETH